MNAKKNTRAKKQSPTTSKDPLAKKRADSAESTALRTKRAATIAKRPKQASGKKLPRTSRNEQQIYVVTDGTGGLPRHILAAVLSQFPNLKSPPQFEVFCNTVEQVESAARRMKRSSIVLFALAEAELKSALHSALSKKKIVAFDMIGGIVGFLADATGEQPVNDLGCVHQRDEDYFDRIDAWEFTLQHDDSRRLESIQEAEIVLVGLSRVSKTPTAAYLGWLGHRVANVSFATEVGMPEEIKGCRNKLVALTMQAKRLAEIRQRRLRVNRFQAAFDADPSKQIKYADVRDTVREVMEAESIYRKLRIPIVDTTDLTVEEIAMRILEALGKA